MSKTELSLEALALESIELLPDRDTMQAVAIGALAVATNSVTTGDITDSDVDITQTATATATNSGAVTALELVF
jgi:hypothetical protein